MAVNSLIKSENLTTATGTRRPKLPVLIYSQFLRCHKIAKRRVNNGTESNGLYSIFANKGNYEKRFGVHLYFLKYFLYFLQ